MMGFLGDKKLKRIYLDYAAATPIRQEVKDVMIRDLAIFANPGTIHKDGVEASNLLEGSRQKIADELVWQNKEVVFTSGATESNNLAILGVLSFWQKNNPNKIPHFVTTRIEHPSVLEVFKKLEQNKLIEVTYLPVKDGGIIDIKKFRTSLKKNTILVSIMSASNEIGTIQPIKEVSKEIRHFKKYILNNHKSIYPLLHTDASQILSYEKLDIRNFGVDLITISSEKIYGPKGVAMLYVKSKTPINKIFEGGDQEFNLRPGTPNVSAISGFAKAIELAINEREVESTRIKKIQEYCFDQLETKFSGKFIINGSLQNRLPNNINITFKDFDSELLVIELDACGISVSEKSACSTEDDESSYVINALRKDYTGSIRISFGKYTKKSDVDFLIKSLDKIFEKYKNIKL